MSIPTTPTPEYPATYLFSFHRAIDRDVLHRHAMEKSWFNDTLVMSGVFADYDLALISFDGETFGFTGLFTSSNRASISKRRAKFERIRKLATPIPIRAALARAKMRVGAIDATARIHTTTITKENTTPFHAWIRSKTPANAAVFAELLRLRSKMITSRSDPAHLKLSEERDSVGLVLDIAGLDRAAILGNTSHDEPPKSIIDSLPPSTPSTPSTGKTDERRILEHDMAMFGDWRYERPRYSTTRRYTDGRSTVTLLYVDNSDVETAVGVDLIYHIDTYDSFVMIQYKRMTDGLYRPGTRCHEQTRKMLDTWEFMESTHKDRHQERDFRLSRNPFFFKVCDGAIRLEYNEALIEGMYFPLDHWRLLMNDPRTHGPRDGVQVSRQTAPRWINNTNFVDMAKKGWIGSTQLAGQGWVRKLVRERLRDPLERC